MSKYFSFNLNMFVTLFGTSVRVLDMIFNHPKASNFCQKNESIGLIVFHWLEFYDIIALTHPILYRLQLASEQSQGIWRLYKNEIIRQNVTWFRTVYSSNLTSSFDFNLDSVELGPFAVISNEFE